MKLLAVIISAVIISAIVPLAFAQGAPQKINITATLEGIRTNEAGRVRYYLLWVKAERSRPIGHAYSACQTGPLDVDVCTNIYSFPLGRITTVGEIHRSGKNSSVVTGGTRNLRAKKADHPGYAGVHGTLLSIRLSAGTFQLIFLLYR